MKIKSKIKRVNTSFPVTTMKYPPSPSPLPLGERDGVRGKILVRY